MPEGDTVWRAARELNTVLAGQTLTRCDIRVPKFATTDFSGHTVADVVSRGKHLLIRLDGSDVDGSGVDAAAARVTAGRATAGRATAGSAATNAADTGWILHSHLKMEGLWHVYNRGERWRRPAFKARCILETSTKQIVGFDLGFLGALPRSEEDDAVGYLGPDLLGPDWDASEALRRIQSVPERPIGLALLDQRNLAGIGNVYRCEICFLAGVHPLTPVGEVPNLQRIIDLSKRLLEANKARSRRITTGNMGRDPLWVYNRETRGCLRCGTKVAHELVGDNALELRDLYYCPHCQPVSGTRPA
ncbi:DNA-formamidopyrimidine glycosylase family protein [Arthrobacter sp. zg-Y1219]|uniref:DNA-formamidopyrimidine glycosylase family protein n=1 Tax=Arthrobacter sp. zg-Y1219 TaxID=3049067 RepID=UPI0024C32ED2|nr:DNA-formamidopyrimidine glycosylase family protein [Arthrobacter sp. zg-Y1219]MDK1361495.1 DNA-formamidopyrimidine glycosylase family protein [Arthrobacter sp. zg-Y1219]